MTERLQPSGAPERAPPRILIVENDDALRGLQKRILERLDAVVIAASSIDEAQLIIHGQELDLVISDVKAVRPNGLDLFAWAVRERAELADRFLFVAADETNTMIAQLAAHHPDRVVRKPFGVQDYLARVTRLLP